jgi:class 3 adenylate cyclase
MAAELKDLNASQTNSQQAAAEKTQEEMLESLTNRKIGFDETIEYLTKSFPFLAILQTFETNQPYFFVVCGMFIYAMQLLAFVINPHFADAWSHILGEDIATILYSFHFPLYDPLFNKNATPMAVPAMMFALLAAGFVLYFSIGYCRFMTGDKEKQNAHFVYFNRLVFHAMSTWMLIPALQLCAVSMVCGFSSDSDVKGLWMFPDMESAQCWGSTHLPSFVAAGLFVVLVLPLLYLTLLCQFDSHRPDHPKCRRHTFVDQYAFFHSLVSAAMFHILLGYDQRGAFAIIHCISASLCAAAHYYLLPYYSSGVNQFFVVLHSVEALAAAFLAAALLNSTFMASAAASPLLLGFGPVVIVASIMAVQSRVNPIFEHRLDACHSEHALTEVPAARTEACVFPHGLHDESKVVAFANIEQLVKECATRIVHFENQESEFQSVRSNAQVHKPEVLAPYISTVRIAPDVDTAASFVAHYVDELHDNPTIPMLQFAARIYARGLVTFNSDAGVLCAFASFILQFVPPMSFFGLQLIDEVAAKSPSLPLRFRAHVLSTSLRVALGIKNQAHVVHSNAARTRHSKVLSHMNDFWLKLTEPSVNIGQISDVADEITVARDHAVTQFRRALQHQTSSDAVLIHRLGDFLQDVMLDAEAAAECYNEAKDLREARQARSMRGTKQITAVETDLETLTERLLKLLTSRSDISGRSSNSLSHLVLEVSAVYMVLFIIAVLFVYIAVTQRGNALTALDQVYGSAVLRSTAPLFASTVQQAILNGTTFTLNSSVLSPFYSDLQAEASQFSSFWSSVSSGTAKANGAEHISFLSGKYIPNYIPELENTEGLSLFELSQLFQSLADQMTSVAANITTPTVSRTNSLISSTLFALSKGFDHFLSLYETDVKKTSETWLIWVVVLLVIGTVTLVSTYLAFLVSLQRTALGRIFTFQLFTLIPFEALEKLAQETKQKILAIQEEQKPKSAAGEDIHNNEDEENSEGSSRKKSASTSSIHSSIVASGVTLKSCLKKPGQVKVLKKVVISNIVEILGAKEDVDKTAKKDIGAASAKAVALATTEEETERMLMKKPSQSAQVAASQKSAKSSETAGLRDRLILVGGLSSAALLLVVAFVMLGVLLQDLSAAPVIFKSRMEVINELDKLQMAAASTVEVMDVLYLPDWDPKKIMYGLTKLRVSFYDLLGDGLKLADVEGLVQVSYILRNAVSLVQELIVVRSFLEGTDVSWCQGCTSLLKNKTISKYVDSLLVDNELLAIRASRRTSAINGTQSDLYRIFAGLRARQAFTGKESIIEEVQNIRARYAKSTENQIHAVYDNINVKVALAVICAAFFLVCFLLSIDAVEVTGGFLTRPRILLLALTFLVPLGLLAATTSSSGSVHPKVAEHSDDLRMLAALGLDVLELSGSARLFAATSTVLYFYRKESAVADVNVVPKLLSRLGVLTDSNNATWATAQYTISVLRQLSQTSGALTINSMGNAVFVEQPMFTALANADWNYRAEPNFMFLEAFFPTRSPKYSNRSYDLSLSRKDQWQLAIATMTDQRYRRALDQCIDAVNHIYGNVTEAHIGVVQKKMDFMFLLTVVSLATCALPFFMLLLVMSRLKGTVTDLLGLKNNTAGAAVENKSYSVMGERAQVSLSTLFFLLCGSFAIGVWQTTTAADSVIQVNLATKRDFYVSKSLYDYRMLVAKSVSRHHPSQLTDSIASIISASERLFFGAQNSKRYAMGRHTELDRITFGFSDADKTLSAVKSALHEDCEAASTLDVEKRGFFGSLENITIHQALQTWNRLLLEASTIVSTIPYDGVALAEVGTHLDALKGPLTASLTNSTNLLMEAARKDIDLSGNVLIAVAAVFIFSTLLMFAVVFLPMVMKLAEEGESARLLLRMIPSDVRDKVPAIAEYIETGRIDNAAELQKKFEASERLLQNILPQKIASRLKSGEQPIADMHRCLTILFTDFVGFTKRSSNMQAAEIVDFLNEVFLEFDTVTELLELEKIKTIGDAYFMAGGLDPRMTDHAMRVVEAAFLFFESLRDYNIRHPNTNLLQMRLGIHTGPAVAGVIGTKKVAYDLWGESVEIANAMESTGVPGHIHISEDTAKHVEGFYKMEPRGELPREKEHIPDCMPATFLITGRLLPTPYQHIQRPKMLRTSVTNTSQGPAH